MIRRLFILVVAWSLWGASLSRGMCDPHPDSPLDIGSAVINPKSDNSKASNGRRESPNNSLANQQQTLKQIDGHTIKDLASLLASRSEPSVVFPILHEERRWAIDEQHHLNSLIDYLQPLIHEPARPLEVIDRDDYQEQLSRLNREIDENERKQLEGPTEADKTNAHLTLISLTREKGALGAAWIESQKYETDESSQKGARSELDTAKAEYTQVGDYLLGLDDVINSMLLTTDANNDFRKWICIAFSLLVGLVIIGFFLVAYKEKGIRDVIFSNDSGLQFVTLFSLIIAIILFGVINVLEGRELAALLGGLSGYILGRGNLGQSSGRGSSSVKHEEAVSPSEPTGPGSHTVG